MAMATSPSEQTAASEGHEDQAKPPVCLQTRAAFKAFVIKNMCPAEECFARILKEEGELSHAAIERALEAPRESERLAIDFSNVEIKNVDLTGLGDWLARLPSCQLYFGKQDVWEGNHTRTRMESLKLDRPILEFFAQGVTPDNERCFGGGIDCEGLDLTGAPHNLLQMIPLHRGNFKGCKLAGQVLVSPDAAYLEAAQDTENFGGIAMLMGGTVMGADFSGATGITVASMQGLRWGEGTIPPWRPVFAVVTPSAASATGGHSPEQGGSGGTGYDHE